MIAVMRLILVCALVAHLLAACEPGEEATVAEDSSSAGTGAVSTGIAGAGEGWTSVAPGETGGTGGIAGAGASDFGVAGSGLPGVAGGDAVNTAGTGPVVDPGGAGGPGIFHESFPLTGAHQGLPCESCHGSRTATGEYEIPLPPTACSGCHGVPANHVTVPAGMDCSACHNTAAWIPATPVDPGTAGSAGNAGAGSGGNGGAGTGGTAGSCTLCHGDAARQNTALNPYLNSSPPVDTSGNTATTARGVGAHLAHLTGTTLRASAIECTMCHLIPSGGHPDGVVQMSAGALASAAGAVPSWNGSTCSNYCHGATLLGGFNTNPSWTGGPSQAACGACHANPSPTMTHFQHPGMACSRCHPDVNGAGTAIEDPSLHINGLIEAAACSQCHNRGDGEGPGGD